MAPGHLVVETNGKECDVRQEEEHDDESMKVGLSFIDHDGARRCAITGMFVGNACSLYRGCSTPCSERVDHEGALMVKFKGKCAAIEQYEPFKEQKGLPFFRAVRRRTDGRAGARGRRWLGLAHGRTVRRWTVGHRDGRVSGQTGEQTCVTVGRSGGRVDVRSDTGQSVGRRKGGTVGRTRGQSNRFTWRSDAPTADGRTDRRWKREAVRRTVLATDGRAVPRSTVGRADSRKNGRKNGRADGRSDGL